SRAWQPWSSGLTEARSMSAEQSSSVVVAMSVVAVQRGVQFDLRLVRQALDAAVDRVAAEQHVAASGELACLAYAGFLAVTVDQRDLGAGSYVEACLDGAAVAERDAKAGVGANQAVLADADDGLVATGEGAEDAAATAEVAVGLHEDTSGDAPFNHGGAFGTGVEVAEAFVHHGGAFTDVGTEAHARGVGNTHTAGDDVVGHARELVDGENFQGLAAQAC